MEQKSEQGRLVAVRAGLASLLLAGAALLGMNGTAKADGTAAVMARWPQGMAAITTTLASARLHTRLQDLAALNPRHQRADRLDRLVLPTSFAAGDQPPPPRH